eukprot:Colp12_sorted_trinity150504_noHs@35394
MAQLRAIKNVVNNYTDMERKVREATSNDPWGASGTLMAEIAEATDNYEHFPEIMGMIWKRLNDSGKNWRHVYKSLILLDYLVKNGAERVTHAAKENFPIIQTLKDFQYIEPKDGKDVGMNVREKAKALASLLKDDERLKEEREKAKKVKERFRGDSVSSSDRPSRRQFEDRSGVSHDRYTGSPGPQRSAAYDEEEEQVRRVLELSKREAEEAERKRKQREEADIQAAIARSKADAQSPGLVDFSAPARDPWGTAQAAPVDPFGATPFSRILANRWLGLD